MENTDKLKPCPFCGGEAKIMKMGYPHWIYCKTCGAMIHGRVIGEEEGERASAEAWNNRKVITLHKRHVITLKRGDEFTMRRLYESICETLLDEGELVISRTDNLDSVDFVWEITQRGYEND